MAKFIKVIRNNWKKSAVGTVAVLYAVNYAHDKYKVEQVMRAYCEEAQKYGEVPVPSTLKPRHVTVILNPAANRRRAKSNFEKYCAPLLHLAGFRVDIVQTESEGQARRLAAELVDTDIIVVAGGDGTLSETVTGLMRSQGRVKCPLGVLPLGRTNSVACALLGRGKEGDVEPAEMAAAAMAIVRGQTKALDTIRVDLIQNEEESSKPVYGLSGIRWGVFRDALSKQDKYWYWGGLRGYAAVVFHRHRPSSSPMAAHVVYTPPCEGCSLCYQSRPDLHPTSQRRWYQYLLPSFTSRTPEVPQINYRQVVNPQCGVVTETDFVAADINIFAPCVCEGSNAIRISIGPTSPSWSQYVQEGWRRVRGEPPTTTSHLDVQNLELLPSEQSQFKEGEEQWFSIDHEEYEVRPVRVTLMPKSVLVFCPQPPQTYYTLLERALLGAASPASSGLPGKEAQPTTRLSY